MIKIEKKLENSDKYVLEQLDETNYVSLLISGDENSATICMNKKETQTLIDNLTDIVYYISE